MSKRSSTGVIVVASAGAFAASLSTSLVAISAPMVAADLHVSTASASWILSAYLLSASACLTTAGRLSEVVGPKRLYLTGVLFFAFASAMCASAASLGTLIGARVFQGVGAAITMALGPALITSAVRQERRGRALGIQLATTYAGLAIGPGLGGVLAAQLGWQAIFVVVAGVSATSGVLALFLLEADEERPPRRTPLDVGGAVLFAAMLTAVLIALRRAPTDGLTSRNVMLLLAFVAVALLAFVRTEMHHPAPLLPPSLATERRFASGIVALVLLHVVTLTVSFLLPFHLERTRGFSASHAGTLMAAQPAAMAVVAPLSGALSDRIGVRGLTVGGMLVVASGVAWTAAAADGSDVSLSCALAVVGLGAGLFATPNYSSIMSAAPRGLHATASAVAATARGVGMATGVAVAASLEPSLGTRVTLLTSASIALGAAILGGFRPRDAANEPVR